MTKNMKKLLGSLMAVAAVFALAMVMMGCSSTSLSAQSVNGTDVSIAATNADEESMVMTSIMVEDGQNIVVDSALTSGTLHISFIDESEIADPDEFNFDDANVLFEYEATGTGTDVLEATPGTYGLVIAGDASDAATGGVELMAVSQ